MKAAVARSSDLYSSGLRLEGGYHASSGMMALRTLCAWSGQTEQPAGKSDARSSKEPRRAYTNRRLDRLEDVCIPGGVFIPSRFTRVFVEDSRYGAPYLTGGSVLQADPFTGAKLLSNRFTKNMDELALRRRMTIVTCSGAIGNAVYINGNFDGTVGSPDLIRIVADPKRISSGYLYAVIASPACRAMIQQKTYGAVVPHVEAHHVLDIPIPRVAPETEQRIHNLMEQAAELRVQANRELKRAQERFQTAVLRISPLDWKWRYRDEHAFAVGTSHLDSRRYRLDAFHHIGYVQEAERAQMALVAMGELVDAYQPPLFKRPYTDERGIPFLSGIDLYDAYPKPHMHISRRMSNLDRYIVSAGTILVQNVGQRYGLFGRPTILPRHLDQVAVTQHLMRVYPKDPRDRGFVYTWLSTEFGRRLLLKQSFGTSMGVLFEHSFQEMPTPVAQPELRHSFELQVEDICNKRDASISMEDQAQALLAEALNIAISS